MTASVFEINLRNWLQVCTHFLLQDSDCARTLHFPRSCSCHSFLEPALRCQYSDRDTSRRLRDGNPRKGKAFFCSQNFQNRSGAHTARYSTGAWVLCRWKCGSDVKLTNHFHLTPEVTNESSRTSMTHHAFRKDFSFTRYHSLLLNF